MSDSKKFKIGELSKLFNISVDSIRYYEKVGILEPVRNPENNYRFYTMEDFRRLALIREMLGLGFSTEQIHFFITDRNIQKTKDLLYSELDTIDEEIKRLKKTRKSLEHRIDTILSVENRYNGEKITEFNYPERPCVMIREKHLTDEMIDYYLVQYMNKNNNHVGTIGLNDCYTLDLENSNPESNYYRTKNAFFYSNAISKREFNYYLPAGIYLSIIYRGPLTKTKQLLPSMFDYAVQKGYTVCGDPIELCYIDEYETNDESEYLIEIQLPVEYSE